MYKVNQNVTLSNLKLWETKALITTICPNEAGMGAITDTKKIERLFNPRKSTIKYQNKQHFFPIEKIKKDCSVQHLFFI